MKTPRKEQMRVEKLFHEIAPELIGKYHLAIDTTDYCISVHEPSYININKPVVEKNDDCVITLRNKKIIVTLWKNVFFMHVTVL